MMAKCIFQILNCSVSHGMFGDYWGGGCFALCSGMGRGQQTFAECQGRGKRKEREKKSLSLFYAWNYAQVILRRKGQYNKVLDVKQLYELACVCVFCYKLLLWTVYFVFSGVKQPLEIVVSDCTLLHCFILYLFFLSAHKYFGKSTFYVDLPKTIYSPSPLLAGAAFLCFCAQVFFFVICRAKLFPNNFVNRSRTS